MTTALRGWFRARAVRVACVAVGLCSGVLAHATAPQASDAVAQPARHVYRTVGGQDLAAFVFAPTSSDPSAMHAAILLLHPGGWRAGSADWEFDDARRFAAMGLVAIAVDYRLAKNRLTPVVAFEDTCAAFAWTRAHAAELHVDPQRVAGYGESAGGQLVASAGTVRCPPSTTPAAQGRPDLMVLVSPVLDTAHDAYALLAPLTAHDHSPLEHAGYGTPPTLIVQGGADTRTPVGPAERFCRNLRELRIACEIAFYEKLGHLLTRNLADQEGDIDPDPVALADAQSRERRFLAAHGFIPTLPRTRATRR